MTRDAKDFWQRFQTGIDVAVASDLPGKLLGVRDGFRRYFHDGLARSIPVNVVPRPQDEARTPLPLRDDDILALARRRAHELDASEGDAFDFHVASETGILSLSADGERRSFVRSWTVVIGLGDEAWGSSGSIQLPELLIHGLDTVDLPFAIPGTRRRGGMVASLTGAVETRRTATALATLHALSTLLYGRLESRPQPRHRPLL